jgi:hypothetical protein
MVGTALRSTAWQGTLRASIAGVLTDSLMPSLALRLIGCSVVAYLAWLALGAVGLVYASVVVAVAVAGPLLDAALNTRRFLRILAFRRVEGRHVAYRGRSIDVLQDLDGRPWLRLDDVRRILPDLLRDESLQRLLGDAVQALAPDPSLRIEAAALVAYLEPATQAQTAKFRDWVDRSLARPKRKLTPDGQQRAASRSSPG